MPARAMCITAESMIIGARSLSLSIGFMKGSGSLWRCIPEQAAQDDGHVQACLIHVRTRFACKGIDYIHPSQSGSACVGMFDCARLIHARVSKHDGDKNF